MSKYWLLIVISLAVISTLNSADVKRCDAEQNAADINTCTEFNSGDPYGDYCCLYTPETGNARCKLNPYSALQNVITYDFIGNTLYKVNCGDEMNSKTKSVLSPCGEGLENPSLAGCKTYSSYVDSCCYYNKDNAVAITYPETETGCYWLGSKYMGDITWGSLKLKCASNYISNQIYIMAIIMIFLIFN